MAGAETSDSCSTSSPSSTPPLQTARSARTTQRESRLPVRFAVRRGKADRRQGQCISEAFGVDLNKAEDKSKYSLGADSLASILEAHVTVRCSLSPARADVCRSHRPRQRHPHRRRPSRPRSRRRLRRPSRPGTRRWRPKTTRAPSLRTATRSSSTARTPSTGPTGECFLPSRRG